VASYEHDGLQLNYEVGGTGPAVLCVHGATGTGQYDWQRLADRLQDSYRVVMPDLRSHGGSDSRLGALDPQLIDGDLKALIDREGMDTPHIVGFSFGSEVALRFELGHPGTAKSLVLVSPGLGTAKPGSDVHAEMPSRELLKKVWPETLRGLHAERHGPDHWLDIMQELWVRHAERPLIPLTELTALTCPVLLICGSDDDPRRIRQSRQFAASNPHVRLVEIEGAGHAVHKERPDQVVGVISDFLDAVSESASDATTHNR
jgi:pimeloyl-ACP methyl ester carboxylesterase